MVVNTFEERFCLVNIVVDAHIVVELIRTLCLKDTPYIFDRGLSKIKDTPGGIFV